MPHARYPLERQWRSGWRKVNWPMVGGWAFVLGVALSIVSALAFPTMTLGTFFVLGALGILAGLLNISQREVGTFLFAGIAFLLSLSALSQLLLLVPGISGFGPAILENVRILVAPALGVVSLKALYNISKVA